MKNKSFLKISVFLLILGFYTLLSLLQSGFMERTDIGNTIAENEKKTTIVQNSSQNITDRQKMFHICSRFFLERRSFPRIMECRDFKTRLCEDGSFNATALVSFPGSGNTWVRHLLEMSSGVFTGSLYFDEELYGRGFLGEKEDWKSGTTIVQKSHIKYNSKKGFKRGVLIIRDPIMATRSFVDYLESGHTGWASPNTFSNKDWPLFLVRTTYDWMSLAKSWLEAEVDLLVVHYENILMDPVKQVKRICTFLGIDHFRVDTECFNKSLEGSFRRKKPRWKIKTLIPVEFHTLIDDGVEYLNKLLMAKGHDPIPFDKYPYYRKNITSL